MTATDTRCLICRQPTPPARQFCPEHQPTTSPNEANWNIHDHEQITTCRCHDPELEHRLELKDGIAMKWRRDPATGLIANTLVLRWSEEPGDGGIEYRDLLDIIAERVRQQAPDMMSTPQPSAI